MDHRGFSGEHRILQLVLAKTIDVSVFVVK